MGTIRRTILFLAVVALALVMVAPPASARGPVGACGASQSGWVLVSYVLYPYDGWEETSLWTTWTGWVEEDGYYAATGRDAFGTYVYIEEGAAAADTNEDLSVCIKLATPVPTDQPQLASPWLFDWDIFLLDNVRGPKG